MIESAMEKRACGSVFQPSLFLLCESESSSESDCDSEDDSSCSSSSDSDVIDVIAEIKRKKAHPDRLHEELWYNDPGQVGCEAKVLGVQRSFSQYIENFVVKHAE